MRYRRIALVIALYVTVDLTNPFVGGAFSFDAEESMDGVARQHERLRHQEAAESLPMSAGEDRAEIARSVSAPPAPSRLLGEWFVHLRLAHAPQSDPQSPAEDH